MPGIVVLTRPTPHAWIIINAVVERFGRVTVLTEERESRRSLIWKRMKRRGPLTVLGQVAFVMGLRFIEERSQRRIDEIIREHRLDPSPNSACTVIPVRSVNSTAARAALAMIKPDVVLVIGTRIIGRETLAAVNAPMINYHPGINPKYRGQAGGYWALAAGDRDNAGVSVHLVDEGVDTGGVLYQTRFTSTSRDNFSTYFFLQAAAARPLVLSSIEDALAGRLKVQTVALPSQQFYHPTIWSYLWTGWRRRVW
jgi:folate-dependent phosphoribosylglycinamide formyltransferase PurN